MGDNKWFLRSDPALCSKIVCCPPPCMWVNMHGFWRAPGSPIMSGLSLHLLTSVLLALVLSNADFYGMESYPCVILYPLGWKGAAGLSALPSLKPTRLLAVFRSPD